MQPYSISEARSAFARLLRHHQANGWDPSAIDVTQPGSNPSARVRPSMHKKATAGPFAAPTHFDVPASTSQQQLPHASSHQQLPHATIMHEGCNSTPSAAHNVQPGVEQPEAMADTQQLLAVSHIYAVASQATARHDSAHLRSDSTTVMTTDAAMKHALASVIAPAVETDDRIRTEVSHAATSSCRQSLSQASGYCPEDLTLSPGNNAANDQQEHITSAAAQQVPVPTQQGAADHAGERQLAVDELPGLSGVPIVVEVVDLLSPKAPEAKVNKRSRDGFAPSAVMKRRKVLPKVCCWDMQGMFAFQGVPQHLCGPLKHAFSINCVGHCYSLS